MLDVSARRVDANRQHSRESRATRLLGALRVRLVTRHGRKRELRTDRTTEYKQGYDATLMEDLTARPDLPARIDRRP